MNQPMSTKVLFTAANVGKCKCPVCPVQAKSQCVSGKLQLIKEALAKNPMLHEDIPGGYCATGQATCQDLDPKQSCICGSCSVFSQSKLDQGTPVGYFCRDGFAV